MSSSSSAIHSVATNGKGSLPVNLPYLPDDLLLNCLARVSRFYYPTLSLVSKRFRSLVASKDIYKTRTLIGCTESCIHACFLDDLKPRWFILCRRQTRNPNFNPNKSIYNVIDTFPTCNYSRKFGWDLLPVGSNIYMIGGLSYRVHIMDCRSHTWCDAPSMRVARTDPSICLLDGKIYVAGGYKGCNSSNWMECFDPKTQKWELVPIHDAVIPNRIYSSFAIDGNLYLVGDNSMVYKPKENRCDAVGLEMNYGWENNAMDYGPDSFCVIDNVFYCYGSSLSNSLQWYDNAGRSWRVVEELSTMLPNSDITWVQLVNYGGNIAVLWDDGEDVRDIDSDSKEKMIWCAEISLERRNKHKICGKVLWCEVVLTVPDSYHMQEYISVTV